jgi:hypothetical protein
VHLYLKYRILAYFLKGNRPINFESLTTSRKKELDDHAIVSKVLSNGEDLFIIERENNSEVKETLKTETMSKDDSEVLDSYFTVAEEAISKNNLKVK